MAWGNGSARRTSVCRRGLGTRRGGRRASCDSPRGGRWAPRRTGIPRPEGRSARGVGVRGHASHARLLVQVHNLPEERHVRALAVRRREQHDVGPCGRELRADARRRVVQRLRAVLEVHERRVEREVAVRQESRPDDLGGRDARREQHEESPAPHCAARICSLIF